jgi:YfiH family protein
MITTAPLNEIGAIRHAFFTRQGGVSEGIFASLNTGFGSGDERDKVTINRARAMARLDLEPQALLTARQVHSAKVEVLEGAFGEAERPTADGFVTRTPGIALGILTADCAPVLFADATAGVIGAAHAGWPGALGGVLEATIEAMAGLGAKAANTVAAIGPCIGKDSYEVGPEYPAPFLAEDRANGRFFAAAADGHYHFDFPAYIAARVGALGLGEVVASGHDTCAEEDRFFSYRRSVLRGEEGYGRGLSAIALVP